MAKTSSSSVTLVRRYVTALLDAATERGVISGLQAKMHELLTMVRESDDLRYALTSPLIKVDVGTRGVMAVMDRALFPDILKGFVRTVLKNRRGPLLEQMLLSAITEIDARNGHLKADVDVASPLGDLQHRRLAEMLSSWSGAKVSLNVRVSPDVIGGIKIRLGTFQIDDSVSGKLARLHQVLLGSAS